MKTRIISGIAMLPLLIVVIIGGYVLKAFAFIIGIMAVAEFFKVHKYDGFNPSLPIAVGSAVLLYLFNLLHFGGEFYLFWIFASITACLLYTFRIDKRITEDATITMLGIVYVIFFMFHLALMVDLPGYKKYIWLILITAFITDIAAYFSGKFFGKSRLCPNISPKKTVAGAIGGLIASAVFSLIFGIIFLKSIWFHCLIIGILGSVAGQCGDLTASVIKRNVDTKDYGNLIPGHGGVMDRVDSILFTAPVIYWYIQIFLV